MKTTQELYGVLNSIRVARKANKNPYEFCDAIAHLFPRIEEVLTNAEKTQRLFLVVHTHDGGCVENVSAFLYFSDKDLTERQVCQRLGIDYEPKRGEDLEIREIPNIPTI